MIRIGLLCLAAAMGAGLYQTKHEVSLLDRQLRDIARGIDAAETRRQSLAAEWAWLTEPERLRSAVQRHLVLEPMQPAQFVRLAEAERRLPPVVAHTGPVAFFAPRPPMEDVARASFALLPRPTPPVTVAAARAATDPASITSVGLHAGSGPVVPSAVGSRAHGTGGAVTASANAAVLPAQASSPSATAVGGPGSTGAGNGLAPSPANAFRTPAQGAPAASATRAPGPGEAVAMLASAVAAPADAPARPGAEAPRPAARAAARPAPRLAPEVAALPAIARPAAMPVAHRADHRADQRADNRADQRADAVPRPIAEPPAPSALGTPQRPLLPPPVPFGSAQAATGAGPR